MPLIQIVRNPVKIDDATIKDLLEVLPGFAARELSCEEGGHLSREDIMIEVSDFGPLSINCKDLHIRVWAHDYPSRRGKNLERLEKIKDQISELVTGYAMIEEPWNVWVLLAITAYGSDTTD